MHWWIALNLFTNSNQRQYLSKNTIHMCDDVSATSNASNMFWLKLDALLAIKFESNARRERKMKHKAHNHLFTVIRC